MEVESSTPDPYGRHSAIVIIRPVTIKILVIKPVIILQYVESRKS